MHALVTATLLSACPGPADMLAAGYDLAADPGAPVLAERSARTRIAAVVTLCRLGGLDADAGDYRWFDAQCGWESEHDHARRLVRTVRTCPPPAADWLPPPAWFRQEAEASAATAAAWRKRAEEYRGRAEFEGHQSEELLAWARYMDAVADRYAEEACRFASWGGTSWSKPRRVVVSEYQAWARECSATSTSSR